MVRNPMFRLLSNTSEEEWLQDSSLPLTRELTTTSLSTKLDRPETTLHKSSKEETSARTESMRTFTGSPTQIPRLSTGQDLKSLSCQMDQALKPIRTSLCKEEMVTFPRKASMRMCTTS